MGMDSVEIVMEVEDAFDICIEDAQAEKITTPRQLIDLIEHKVANVRTPICLTHRAFNLLRAFLMRRHSLPRLKISPDAEMGQLIPPKQRANFLSSLAIELDAGEPPALKRPKWLFLLLLAISIAAAVLAGWRAAPFYIAAWPVGILIGLCGAVVTKPLRTEFPKKFTTVGDLSQWIRKHKPDLATQAQRTYTREQIAARVREIVIKILGCEKQYHEDARFVQDLGMD